MKLLRISVGLIALLCLFFDTSYVLAGNELAINGQAVILMDAKSGRVLYERNGQEQLPPASLTKIMTGLLVTENGNLDKKVTVSKHAADTPECTIYLEPGEVLTRLELLYAALLPSANDASVALAESIAGSEANFLEMMNQRAEELGLQNTHFVNPHGLHYEEHYTSAYDLALLTKTALSNRLFAKVASTPRAVIPWDSRPDEDRLLLNQNKLLHRYDGAIGVKTGYTRQAGNCVVGAAKRGDMVLIAVSMNSSTVYEDLEILFDYGFENYYMASLGKSHDLSRSINVRNGESSTVTVLPATDLLVAVTDEEAPYLAYSLEIKPDVTAPIQTGDILGNCNLFIREESVGNIDLIAMHDVGIQTFSWTTTLFTVLKGLSLLTVCLLFIKMIRKRLRQQNSKGRIPSQYRRPHY